VPLLFSLALQVRDYFQRLLGVEDHAAAGDL
jgi:hypothetical protein